MSSDNCIFPIPAKKYFPKINQDHWDTGWEALSNFLDSHHTTIKENIEEFRNNYDPLRIRQDLLDELGYLLAADILPYDSETIKRQKCASAVLSHKSRGLWADDIKPRIEIITGQTASLVTINDLMAGDWIALGGNETTLLTSYFGTIAGDDSNSDLGLIVCGSGYEVTVSGNIYIDIGSGLSDYDSRTRWTLTGDGVSEDEENGTLGVDGITDYGLSLFGFEPSDIIEQLIIEFEQNRNFAYYILHFGYIDDGGQWVEYAVLE